MTFLPRKQRVYFILEGKYMSLFKCYIFLKTIMINAQSNINRCLIFKPTISSLFRVLWKTIIILFLSTSLLNYANVDKTQYGCVYYLKYLTCDYFNKNANDMDVRHTDVFWCKLCLFMYIVCRYKHTHVVPRSQEVYCEILSCCWITVHYFSSMLDIVH